MNAIKEWNNAICSHMDGPRDYQTKRSKPKTDIIRYHFHGGFKKKRQQCKWIYIRNRNWSKDMENKPIVAKRGGVEDKLGVGD